MKDYLLRVLETTAPEDGPLQDAIEYAIHEHHVPLCYDLALDVRRVVARLPAIRAAYARLQASHEAHLTEIFGPLEQQAA